MKEYYEFYKDFKFEDLKGKTLVKIKQDTADWLYLTDSDGNKYRMYPDNDVYLEDMCGEFKDILNQEILLAECVEEDSVDKDVENECQQWTFYKLSTLKGSLTLRWYGASNGYYSIDVDFGRLTRREKTAKEIAHDIKYEKEYQIKKAQGLTDYFVLPFDYAPISISRTFETNPTRRLSVSPTLAETTSYFSPEDE